MSKSRLGQPLTLPCGLQLPNRLVKAAMAEKLADANCLPTTPQMKNVYSAWANGGWGLVMSGNVQVDVRYLGQAYDVSIDATRSHETTVEVFKDLANICKVKGTPTLLQLNHPGRQSPPGAGTKSFWDKSLAPSPIPLNFGPGIISWLTSTCLFGTPKEMTQTDIEDVVNRFVYAATVAAEAGFDGVELHAAHGYLLSQFLSPKANLRTDAYGGSPAARTKIVVDILKAIRAAVPPTFCVGLKLNSTDHQTAGNAESKSELADALEQASLIADTGLDFLEISGGSYEKPSMMTGPKTQSKRTAARESYFLDFAKELRTKIPDMTLMVTGGFRTREGMEDALAEGACDLIGIARPAIINPALPQNTIFNPELSDEDAKIYAKKIEVPYLAKLFGARAVGAGYEIKWYTQQIHAIQGSD
ncbi:unnamed protein product [Clonostachys solani]|uniref:NADH:flavin oxidoreductase/NADH oxidase N-terminal domain-containing protein n=1 Tax=Clonostachys solani TaxID=160281 RepID=A0A9N9Z0G3_9HYPO|nr:unnamed protein product [Clonostachys solani]